MRAPISSMVIAVVILGSGTPAEEPTPAEPDQHPAAMTRPSWMTSARLIEQLGAESFTLRQEAEEELRRRGDEVAHELRRATRSSDPEIRLSARRILDALSAAAAAEDSTPSAPRRSPPGRLQRGLRVQRLGELDRWEEDLIRLLESEERGRTEDLTPRDHTRRLVEESQRMAAQLDQLVEELERIFERDPAAPASLPELEMGADAPSLGVIGESLPAGERLELGVPAGVGILVHEVVEGGAAAAAGMLVGDVLLSIDGEAVGSPAEVRSCLETRLRRANKDSTAARKVRVALFRDRFYRELELELDRVRPPR
jgi:hypothetical protein